jgi:hypothetical protein
MRITITSEELDAVSFAIDQIETLIEASDDEYADDASKILHSLYGIMKKYKSAKAKCDDLNDIKKYIRSQDGRLPKKDIEKLARKIISRTL